MKVNDLVLVQGSTNCFYGKVARIGLFHVWVLHKTAHSYYDDYGKFHKDTYEQISKFRKKNVYEGDVCSSK